MLKKLSAYPRQNGLAVALRELGRLDRSLSMLRWLLDLDLRRRAQAGLNKGEARNALARTVFFCQLGELRDRTFENQATAPPASTWWWPRSFSGTRGICSSPPRISAAARTR